METAITTGEADASIVSLPTGAGPRAERRRERRALATSVAGISYRVLDAATKLLTIPIAARCLGIEQYGIWLTANSLLSLLMVSDFGIGSGLLNAVGAARARGDDWEVRSLTATAYLAFAVLAVALLSGVTILSHTELLVHWLGIESKLQLIPEAKRCFTLLGYLVSTAAALNVINFFALALQEGYLEYLAQIAASVSTVVLILTVRTHDMAVFALITSLPIIVAYLLLTAGLFGFRYRHLVPAFRGINSRCFSLIWQDSSRLLLAQIADTVIAFTSNVLVASQLGAAHVPEVSVSLQAMMVCSFVCCMFLLPLWPAYVEARVVGDWKWIRRALRTGILRSMSIIILVTSVYACVYRVFIHTWSAQLPIPPLSFVLYLDGWFLLYVWNKNFMVFLNGLGYTRVRAWAAPISAVVFVLSVRSLMRHFGVSAVGLGGIISALAEAAITNTWSFGVLSSNSRKWNAGIEVASV
jgi:O-antigen/teichoic acid export membrane protein